MRVLVVEDSPIIRASVGQALREAGYAVDEVGDGRRGLLHARTTDYDAVVMDLGLPEMDGIEVLRQLRDKGVKTPILILTARDSVEDRVSGLRTGADDYLIKPFALAELLARVRALIRRASGISTARVRVGPVEIDTECKIARVVGKGDVGLSPREYALLEYLALRVGRPVPRHELEEHLYDSASQVQSNAIDTAVYALRAKLESAGCPPMIHTRRKVGYVLSVGEEA